jgi:hypothetical protein
MERPIVQNREEFLAFLFQLLDYVDASHETPVEPIGSSSRTCSPPPSSASRRPTAIRLADT